MLENNPLPCFFSHFAIFSGFWLEHAAVSVVSAVSTGFAAVSVVSAVSTGSASLAARGADPRTLQCPCNRMKYHLTCERVDERSMSECA